MYLDTWKKVPVTHNLYFIDDPHCLTPGFSAEKLEAAFYDIKHDEKALVICGGDYASEFKTHDKRFHRRENRQHNNTLSAPYKYFSDLIKKYKIAGKIKGVHNGNHDDDWDNIPLVIDHICEPNNLPYIGYAAKITVKDNRGSTMYKIFTTHGRGRTTSMAHDPKQRRLNEMLAIKRRMQGLAGDVDVMHCAHFHLLDTLLPEQTLYLTDDGKKLHAKYTHSQMSTEYIHPDLRWYGAGGSFQKTFEECQVGEEERTTYAERFMLKPREIGYLILRVEDRIIKSFDRITAL